MMPEWFFDEQQHAGEEHLDPDQVARYDEKIPFDPFDEIELPKKYGLSTEDTVIDFATGTGEFPLAIAEYCDHVVAVDVSETMLEKAREKAEASDVENIELIHSGIVSYTHEREPASFVFSKSAFHHLPDFWKVEALKTVGEALEPGGIFRFRDLVYSFEPADSHEHIEAWLDGMEPTLFTDEELNNHFRKEFSTYDFLMEPMLEQTGFKILDASYRQGFYASYTCKWHGDTK
jgi:putative AdoMet-dependent methyltransferase